MDQCRKSCMSCQSNGHVTDLIEAERLCQKSWTSDFETSQLVLRTNHNQQGNKLAWSKYLLHGGGNKVDIHAVGGLACDWLVAINKFLYVMSGNSG